MSTTKTIRTASELRGVFPALFTPLADDDPKRLNNTIDYSKAKRMIDDLVNAGASGLVPVGTTGQSPTLSHQQHLDFIRFTVEYLDGRLPIIAGAGSNCTRESVDMINRLQQELGQVAALCVTGYYNNPPQEGLQQHYRMLSRETGAKIVIYNVPGRTASYLEAETLIELAADENIIGVKQAVDFRTPGRHREDTIRVVRETRSTDFALVSGEDDSLPAVLELGGTGIITASGCIPEAAVIYTKMIEAHSCADAEALERLQQQVLTLVRGVFCRKNPIPLGTFFNSPLYLPLVSVRDTQDGEAAHGEIMKLVQTAAPSLRKYHE